jgi:putative ABC transport system permease protein
MFFYRALLRLFPASFRAEYGPEMEAIFARRWDAPGVPGRLALALGAVADVVPNALRAHGDILRQDLRYARRTFGRSPGFTATAVVITALGVGAVTAAFSITDHVLIRPLPFTDSERLVHLWGDPGRTGQSRVEPSLPNYLDWKRASASFEAMGASHPVSANLVGGSEPQHLEGIGVDADLLPLLGARPLLGRLFTAEDHLRGAAGTVLVSERVWKERFGGDPSVVGRKVLLDGEPFTLIGVMPRRFQFPSRDTEIWTPMRLSEDDANDRTNAYFTVLARLRKGVSIEDARAEMRLIGAQLERAYPKENTEMGVSVFRLRDELSPQSRLLLVALLGAAVAVLLIACTNLANLLLARALSRRRELAVRTAMGAGRERLVRQLITESLILAASGGALGIALAVAVVPLIARLVPNALPIAEVPSVDLRMLVFAVLLTGVTGVGFGVIPALRACNPTNEVAGTSGLREGARAGSDRRTERLRSALVVAEVAASVALLIGSGLLLRALWRLQGTDPGFRPASVLTLHTALPLPKYEPTQRRVQFYGRVLADVRAMPGVSSAAYISALPMVMRGGIWTVSLEGQPVVPALAPTASLRFVTPGFFQTLGIPVRLGRDVAETDTHAAPFVAVVSDSFARRHWVGQNPLGRRFQFGFHDRTVVGVVGDIKVRGFERSSEPQVYLSYQQADDGEIIGYVPKDLVLRTSEPPGRMVRSIREIVSRADPEIPVSDVRALSDIVRAETAPRRVQAWVLGAFAGIAFLLAAIGIHGLLAFTVSQRLREIGVRVAMGAQPRDILSLVLRQGVVLCAVGVALGVAVAYAAGRSMQALLAGVSPGDAPTFASAVALSIAMTLLGSLLPALRAVRVDPMTVIRTE